jgi:Penicillin binding protein transpeptidase domain
LALKRALLTLLCGLVLVGSAGAAPAAWHVVVLDATTGRFLADQKNGTAADLDHLARVTPGSTLKPFLIAAALDGGLDPDQTIFCRAQPITTSPEKRCWLAAGHGTVGLTRGLGHSCSTFARRACTHVEPHTYRRLLMRLGFVGLPEEEAFAALGCEGWMGREPGITATPKELAEAFRRAFGPRSTAPLPHADLLRAGLRQACREGTARAVGEVAPHLHMMGKTGTVQVTGGARVGVFVGLFPAEGPRRVIVVYALGIDGASTARLAAEFLTGEGKPLTAF